MGSFNKIIYGTVVLMMMTSTLAAPAGVDRRQIGGEAQALYGIVNNVDNGSGYMIENLEDGISNGLNPGSGGDTEYGQNMDGASAPPGTSKRSTLSRRQGNKISNGLGPLLGDLGQQGVGNALETLGDQEDGTLTSGVGDIGTTLGDTEEGTLSEAGYGLGSAAGALIQEGKGAAGKGGAAGPAAAKI